jgi:hypothetical protein
VRSCSFQHACISQWRALTTCPWLVVCCADGGRLCQRTPAAAAAARQAPGGLPNTRAGSSAITGAAACADTSTPVVFTGQVLSEYTFHDSLTDPVGLLSPICVDPSRNLCDVSGSTEDKPGPLDVQVTGSGFTFATRTSAAQAIPLPQWTFTVKFNAQDLSDATSCSVSRTTLVWTRHCC